MARMNVEARAVPGPSPGGRATLVLSITDDAGKPITDLAPEHLFVRAVGDAPEVTVAVAASAGEGIYVVHILPAAAAGAWRSGDHVLAVAVRRVFDRGQCLAVLAIP